MILFLRLDKWRVLYWALVSYKGIWNLFFETIFLFCRIIFVEIPPPKAFTPCLLFLPFFFLLRIRAVDNILHYKGCPNKKARFNELPRGFSLIRTPKKSLKICMEYYDDLLNFSGTILVFWQLFQRFETIRFNKLGHAGSAECWYSSYLIPSLNKSVYVSLCAIDCLPSNSLSGSWIETGSQFLLPGVFYPFY